MAFAVPSGNRVMVGEIELESLTQFLKQIGSDNSLDIFVLDRRGQVIADQKGIYTAQQLNLSNIPLVHEGLQSDIPRTASFQFNGTTMVGSLHRVKGIQWSVLVAQPQTQAYRQLITTGGISVAGVLAALVISMGIALVLARSLAKRFEALAGHAKEVASGYQRSDWPHANISELAAFADNLQQMSESLHERARLLEDEIAERQKAQEELHEKALMLEEEIAERVLAEQTLQVKQTQLEALNLTLETRVQEEVRRNLEKDRLVLHQARQAAMGEMLSNIAHQWRQPLNNIALLIQGSRMDFEDGALDKQTFDQHVRQCMVILKDLSKTIDNFSAYYSRRQEQAAFHLDECVKRSMSVVRSSLEACRITIEINDLPACIINGNCNELSQAMLNIIANARDMLLKRAVERPRIVISGRCDAAGARITIADNAGGVPNEIIDRIFEPYFTTKFKSPGTGIGLYTAKMIVEKGLHGSISVSNAADGAVFSVSMPVSSAETGHQLS